jgi:predicted nucleic acid-binding protein
MITAVDTSVLLDIFGADRVFGIPSRDLLRQCLLDGRVIGCEVVWAELSSFFPSSDALRKAMDLLHVEFEGIGLPAALLAGDCWRSYRSQGGSRERVAADFPLGGHALCQADRLLTRDRGFYRSYFSGLTVLDPTRDSG